MSVDPRLVDQLLATTDDFELCDKVFCAAAELTGNQVDAANEPEPSRTVTLVWHAGGIIGNGGFHFLFSGDFNGDPGYQITAAAFQRINASGAHSAFQEALELFPACQMPIDIDERMRIFNSHPEETRLAIDRRFWNADEETKRSLAVFIRSNKAAIRDQLIAPAT